MGREWRSYDEWNRDRVDPSIGSKRMAFGTYLEGIGTLVQRGLISPEMVADILGGIVIMWWNKVGVYVKEHRVRAGYPMYGEKMEYLYGEMMKLRPAGFSPSFNE
jgi:hypothetical protein